MLTDLDSFDDALNKLNQRRPQPKVWNSEQWADQKLHVRERSFFSSKVNKTFFLQRARLFIKNFMERRLDEDGRLIAQGASQFVEQMRAFAIREGMGTGPASMVDEDDLTDIRSARRLLLIFRTNVRTANGYGSWKQGMDPAVLESFPAARFVRLPGATDPRPRHVQGEGDVRLKSDYEYWATWQNDRAIGGFQTPWPPYGFNSYMDQQDVSRAEAKEMGLLADESKVQPKGAKTPTLNDKLSMAVGNLNPDLKKKLRAELGSMGTWYKGRLTFNPKHSEVIPETKPNPKPKPKAEPDLLQPAETKKEILARIEANKKTIEDMAEKVRTSAPHGLDAGILSYLRKEYYPHYHDTNDVLVKVGDGTLTSLKAIGFVPSVEKDGDYHVKVPGAEIAKFLAKSAEIRKHERAVIDAKNKALDEWGDFISEKIFGRKYRNNSATVQLGENGGLAGLKTDQARVNKAVNLLGAYIGPERFAKISQVPVKVHGPTWRATGGKELNLKTRESIDVILHEYIHAVEDADRVKTWEPGPLLQRSIDYRESRRKSGEKNGIASKILGYDGNFPVLENEWKLSKYSGKIYKHKLTEYSANLLNAPRDYEYASEVMTMWASHAFNPIEFLKLVKDEPDYFWWGYETLTKHYDD